MIPDFVNNERIRKIQHEGQWYYSTVDIIAELLDLSPKEAKNFHYNIKKHLKNEGNLDYADYSKLKLLAGDGKQYLTEVVNDRQALRLIMSLPSPKAEPLKQWLAQIGSERLKR